MSVVVKGPSGAPRAVARTGQIPAGAEIFVGGLAGARAPAAASAKPAAGAKNVDRPSCCKNEWEQQRPSRRPKRIVFPLPF